MLILKFKNGFTLSVVHPVFQFYQKSSTIVFVLDDNIDYIYFYFKL